MWFKSKRTSVTPAPAFKEGVRPEPAIDFEQWKAEFNVSGMYTVHKPVEDRNLVKDVSYDTSIQIKCHLIEESQKRFLNQL